MNKIIFTDFDGTITKTDTCDAMVNAFAKGDYDNINDLWVQKKISTEECANRILKMFDASVEDLNRLLGSIEIDDYFTEFLNVCNENGYPVYVLSDGYDYNIRKIFNKYHINLPFYSNKLIHDSNGFRMVCSIYNNKSCRRCGTCKTGLMKLLRRDNSQVIYIGDGYSDTCAASNADIVFAKGSLYNYCKKNKIDAIKFKSFKDIIESFIFSEESRIKGIS